MLKRWITALCVISLLIFGATAALAAMTPAGTVISNTATANYTVSGQEYSAEDTAETTVLQLLDVAVTWQDGAPVAVQPGDTGRVLTFLVTNTGNGDDGFTLTASDLDSGDQFDTSGLTVYVDANSNDVYDDGTDTLVAAGSAVPIAAQTGLTVFLVGDIPNPEGGLAGGDQALCELVATSDTCGGPKTPGTRPAPTLDAIVGLSGGVAQDDGTYEVGLSVVLAKTATVVDPFGGSEPVPGATITYSITATVAGTGTAGGLEITDPIPLNTTYVAGSLELDGSGLTDDGDADEAEVGGTPVTVTVRLGDVAGGTVHTITFQVTIDSE